MTKQHPDPAAPRNRDPAKALHQLEATLTRHYDRTAAMLAEIRTEIRHVAVTLDPLVDHVAFIERELHERAAPKTRGRDHRRNH